MKNFIFILFLLLAFSSCSRDRAIKDEDLENILHDMFIQNAYSSSQRMDLDSLNMYAPIFRKYGYKEEDMLRTLTLFTRRKSSRFSSVLDRATARLTAEHKALIHQVAMLDKVDSVANQRFAAEVFRDSLIVVSSEEDIDLLDLALAAKPGKYKISYRYRFLSDTIKNSFSVRASFRAVDSLDKKKGEKSLWLNSANVKDAIFEFEAQEGTDSLKGSYLSFTQRTKFTPLEIDSVRIIYYMPLQQALDSLLRSFINYQLTFENIAHDTIPQDSIAHGADTTRLIIAPDTIN